MPNNANMYGTHPPPSGREMTTIGDRHRLRIEYLGSMDAVIHGNRDEMVTLADVS